MDQELVEKIFQDEGTRMMLTLSVADLREFAVTVADNVGRRYAEHTVSEIRAIRKAARLLPATAILTRR